MADINKQITIDRAERFHDDKQLDQYALPALNSDRAQRQKLDIFYIPGQPFGWLVVGSLLLYAPNLLAIIFWLEFIPMTVLAPFSILTTGFVGLGIINQTPNVIARKLMIFGLILGISTTTVQYHHQPYQQLEEIWIQKVK